MKKLAILAMTFIMTVSLVSLSFALKKDVEFEGGAEGKVVFSHEQHTEKVGLKCNECHPKIFQMKKGADKMTMADINDGKFCGTCHNGEKAFDAKSKDNCGKCHQK